MAKNEKEIEKIYVVRDQTPDGSKYTSQILIQYMDQTVKYFNLSSSKLNGSIKKQEKAKQNMEKYLKKIVKDLRKEDYQKLVFVPDHNQELKEYVDRKIRIQKAKALGWEEAGFQFLSLAETMASLTMMLSPLHDPMNVVISSLAASSTSIAAMGDNHERKKILSQEKANWIQKLRFNFSMVLLGINATFEITNLSLHLDNIEKEQAKYQLQTNKIGNRDLYIEGLDNPFEHDATFTSADAATNVLLEAFDLNPLIEEEDQRIARSLRQYLTENPYLDYEALYDDFASFAIIDSNEKNGNIGAICFDDYIMIYDCENKDFEEYSEELKHELVHRTGHLENSMLNEGMTSLITYEYLCDLKYTNAYFDEMLMTKIFCELITPEKMLEAYSKEDMNIIKNELLKLNPKQECYDQLMGLMKKYKLERNIYVETATLASFYDDGHALKYRDSFAMAVMQYMYNANFDEEKVNRITEYLKAMGTNKYFTIPNAIYFNKDLKELSYENAYSSELTNDSDYHY